LQEVQDSKAPDGKGFRENVPGKAQKTLSWGKKTLSILGKNAGFEVEKSRWTKNGFSKNDTAPVETLPSVSGEGGTMGGGGGVGVGWEKKKLERKGPFGQLGSFGDAQKTRSMARSPWMWDKQRTGDPY